MNTPVSCHSCGAVLADRAAHPPVTDGPTLVEVARERDALQSRLDAMRREPTNDELTEMIDGVRWSDRIAAWHYVRDALLTAQEPTDKALPSAPSCTRCMDLRVVQYAGSAAPCPSCGPTCEHGKREGDTPCLACPANLADAERALTKIVDAKLVGTLLPTHAAALLTELARLRAAKESR